MNIYHSMNNNNPRYEANEMSIKECHAALFECLKFKHTDEKILREAISECVPKNVSLGSWRKYYTFLHANYKQKIESWYNHKFTKKQYTR